MVIALLLILFGHNLPIMMLILIPYSYIIIKFIISFNYFKENYFLRFLNKRTPPITINPKDKKSEISTGDPKPTAFPVVVGLGTAMNMKPARKKIEAATREAKLTLCVFIACCCLSYSSLSNLLPCIVNEYAFSTVPLFPCN